MVHYTTNDVYASKLATEAGFYHGLGCRAEVRTPATLKAGG